LSAKLRHLQPLKRAMRRANRMIHYNVRCSHDHEFDGWYRDSAAFDRLTRRGLVECPSCGDTKVERALMAPAVASREALPAPMAAPSPAEGTSLPRPAPPMAMAGGPMPDQMRAMLQRMRAEVEKRCDYVGPTFADEARKIHRGEAEPRSIYGETTPEQAETLSDEGIDFSRIPWVPRADG
jgi:hypothetical protein